MAPTSVAETSERILDIAERLVQTRGYNAFSYADIAAELKVKNAAIHYHFPSKDDLGRHLIERYGQRLGAIAAEIDRGDDARRKLREYVQLYVEKIKDEDQMCLCGMLAADFTTLPRAVRESVQRFFEANERWLAKVLGEGLRAGTLRFEGSPEAEARVLLSALQGGMLVARCFGDPARFRGIAQRLLAELGAKA
jgi:TetR/AcrR family transcriptional repressor of nem operon